ncbi:MAG TPA: glycoside hydrolase 100 family protein [Rhodothermales bacterium]|nr:glycoside hydrolase 100 family protein [Rhodothermales bacterium]
MRQAYQKALEALDRNITEKGFSPCSLDDNEVYGTDANYRSVWARDGAKTVIWTLDLENPRIRECQAATLRTILSHQAPAGQLPAYVLIDSDQPEYGGIGGITAIDGVIWIVIAVCEYTERTGDWSIFDEYHRTLQRCMDWLSAHDANNDGLLEIPEAGDWTDLFARSYHVLYDEVLWYRCLGDWARLIRTRGEVERADDYDRWAKLVRKMILKQFWPSTAVDKTEGGPSFAEVQFQLGDSRYLVAQTSPFGYSWRCDVYGNLLAFLSGLTNERQASMTFRFLWGVGVSDPGPVVNSYPPVHSGDPEWRDYFTVNLLNLPNHYHNGGIWPFIGGLWVRFINALGMTDLARRELFRLSELCSLGVHHDWEFNEWHHGVTGRPMGKAFQAWSAASFVKAVHEVDGEFIRD